MGGETKVTKMLIKVDLQCSKCYKKIKKVLCSFPQIRDQVFDDKTNTVLITVLCCSPEKIRDKICCKGKDAIISIDIIPDKPKEPEKPEKPKVPEKPKEPEKPKVPEKPKEPEKPKAPEKPKEPEKPKAPEKPKEPEKPKQPEKPKEPEKPKVIIVEPPKEAPKPKPAEPPKEPPKPKPAAEPPKEASKPPPAQAPAPAPAPAPKEPEQCFPAAGYPPPVYMGGMCCCQPYYDGYGRGGPCYCQIGYGIPAPPPMCFDGCGRPAYECQGGNRGYYGGGRCRDYFSEENASGCSIM